MSSDEQISDTDPEVVLVFPPLIQTSLGCYYASIAALAGWLMTHSISCAQVDLNADFAEYMLSSPALHEVAGGRAPGTAEDDFLAACARWALINRHRLIDEQGILHFGPDNELGPIMDELAQPFLLAPNPAFRFDDDDLPWSLRWHRDFMETRRWDALLPPSVRLLGISIPMGPQVIPALIMAHAARAAGFSGRIVVGGPAISLMAEDDLERLLRAHPYVDAAVRFDGELPLLSLARQAIQGEWSPGTVAGCSHLASDNRLQAVPPEAGLALTDLPFPVYDKQIVSRLESVTFPIQQARGCYWGKCDYCDFIELFDGSPPYRGRHPAAVVEEMLALNERYGATRFSLITESIPPAFARKMSSLISERGLDFHWDSFAMVDRRFDASLLRQLAAGGCSYLVIGLETMTTRVLNLVHKSGDREQNIRFLQEARAAGLKLHVNLIPDLPSTTYAEAVEALATVNLYRDCIESIRVFPFEATRSSQVGRAPELFGLTRSDSPAQDGMSQYALNNAGYVDLAMTADERVKVHKAYKAFEKQLNNERMSTDRQAISMREELDLRRPLRMAVEEFDWHPVGERVIVTNIMSREVFTMSRPIDVIVRPFLDGQPFLAGEFRRSSGLEDEALVLLERLGAAALIVQAHDHVPTL